MTSLAEWRSRTTGRVLFSTWCTFSVMFAAWSIQLFATTHMEHGYVTCLGTFSCLAGAALLHLAPSFFEVIEVVVFSCMGLVFPILVVLMESDEVTRHGTQIAGLFFSLLMPIFSGMRIKVYIFYDFLIYALHTAAWEVHLHFHESSTSESQLQRHGNVALMCVSSIIICALQLRFISSLRENEENLGCEKQALEDLVSILCDATCWLADDGDTVVRSDYRFSGVVGQRPSVDSSMMDGQASFRQCLEQDDTERARFEKGCDQARKSFMEVVEAGHRSRVQSQIVAVGKQRGNNGPGNMSGTGQVASLLPTSMKRQDNTVVNMDLYMVACRLSGSNRGQKSGKQSWLPCYLVAMRFPQEQPLPEQPAAEVAKRCSRKGTLEMLPEEDSLDEEGDKESRGELSCRASTTSSSKIFGLASGLTDYSQAETLVEVEKIGRREHWFLSPSEISLFPKRIFGRGGFGVVVEASLYGSPVAVKLVHEAFNGESSRLLPQILNELQIFRRLRHPHLLPMYGAVVDVKNLRLALVLEAMVDGNLSKFMRIGGGPTTSMQYQLMVGVCSAMRYLHSRKPCVVHGDLSGRNVLIKRIGMDVIPKLSDFGMSRLTTKHATISGGTLRWMAPEVFSMPGRLPSTKSDVFSFGRVLFFIATKRKPLANLSEEQMRQSLEQRTVAPLTWPPDCYYESLCRPLVERCLQTVASSRPKMLALYETIGAWPSKELLGVAAQVTSVEDQRDWTAGLGEVFKNCPAPNPAAVTGVKEHDHDEDATLVGHTPGTPRLAFPGFQATSRRTQLISLLEHLTRVNVQVSPGACCTYHESVRTVTSICRDLYVHPCQDVPLTMDTQCPKCGLLIEQCEAIGDGCSLCSTANDGSNNPSKGHRSL